MKDYLRNKKQIQRELIFKIIELVLYVIKVLAELVVFICVCIMWGLSFDYAFESQFLVI